VERWDAFLSGCRRLVERWDAAAPPSRRWRACAFL
jgi:hypothetical protein